MNHRTEGGPESTCLPAILLRIVRDPQGTKYEFTRDTSQRSLQPGCTCSIGVSNHFSRKNMKFLLPSSVFSIAFFTVQISTCSHPAMPHGAVCLDVATDTIRADDIGIALDFLRWLIFGCKDDMRNCKFLSVCFVSPTTSE